MKVRDIIKEVEAKGWYFHHQTGSHRVYRHAAFSNIVVIAGHPNEDVPAGTLSNIRKQARGQ